MPQLWRYSCWARRRLFDALQQAIEKSICPQSAVRAKEYHRLINDATFFEPDVRRRFGRLIEAHYQHPMLSKTAAAETAGRGADFESPPDVTEFTRALYYGDYLPIQACLYLEHRGRLYVLKTAVDYWAAREAGTLERRPFRIFDKEYDWGDIELTKNFKAGVDAFSNANWFPRLPVFWQTFLWGWGGFLLRDRLEQEYAALSAQTGIPQEAIPSALTAFDCFFPVGGWFRDVRGEQRRVLKLTPAAMRGIGAYQRQLLYGVEYDKLGYSDWTTNRLVVDHNTAVRLLDGDDLDLVR